MRQTDTPKQILDAAKAAGVIRYWFAAENGYFVRFADGNSKVMSERDVRLVATAKRGRK